MTALNELTLALSIDQLLGGKDSLLIMAAIVLVALIILFTIKGLRMRSAESTAFARC